MSKETTREKFERRYNEEGLLKATSAHKTAGKLFRLFYIKSIKNPKRKERLAREDFVKQYPDAKEEDIALALEGRRIQEEKKKAHGLRVHYTMEEEKFQRKGRHYIENLQDMNEGIIEAKTIPRHQIKEILEENSGKAVTVYFMLHGTEGKASIYKQANLIIDKDGSFMIGKGTFVKEIISPISPIKSTDELQPKMRKVSQWQTNQLIFSENKITAISINHIGYQIEEENINNVGTKQAAQEHVGIEGPATETAIILSTPTIVTAYAEEDQGDEDRIEEETLLLDDSEISLQTLLQKQMSYLSIDPQCEYYGQIEAFLKSALELLASFVKTGYDNIENIVVTKETEQSKEYTRNKLIEGLNEEIEQCIRQTADSIRAMKEMMENRLNRAAGIEYIPDRKIYIPRHPRDFKEKPNS